MKRIILLLIFVFLLTGCSVNYNLDIKSDVFTERIDADVLEKELTEDDKLSITSFANHNINAFFSNENGYYLKKVEENNGKYNITLSYDYDPNSFSDSNILNNCFNDAKFEETDNYYYLSAYGDFNCQYAKKIKVNITSEFAALENNAKKVEGNTYTWYLEEGKEADIFLILSKNVKGKEISKNKFADKFEIIGAIVFIILVAIVLLIYFKKYKKDFE